MKSIEIMSRRDVDFICKDITRKAVKHLEDEINRLKMKINDIENIIKYMENKK